MRLQATLSPPGNGQLRSVVRSYLERPEARADVLQNAPIESWLDRYGIWMTPVGPDSDLTTAQRFTIAHVLSEELVKRFGERFELTEKDIYVVAHEKDGKLHDLHAVIPAPFGLELTREVMTSIGKRMVKELVLERNVERAFQRAANGTQQAASGSRWDLPPTAAQKAVLRANGRFDSELTRGEASLVIEELGRDRSWYRDR